MYSFIELLYENFYKYLREEAPQASGMQANYGSRVSSLFFTDGIQTIWGMQQLRDVLQRREDSWVRPKEI